MKNFLRPLFATGCLAALIGVSTIPAMAKDEDSDKESKIAGSIRVEGKHKRAELPAFAKISFDDALKAAEARVPGKVFKAALEVEHDCLMYSFEILGADNSVTEVEIDAGDGKVLDVDKD